LSNELMTVTEAAQYLRLSKQQVYKLVRAEKVPSIRLGDKILFRKTSLDKYLDQLEVKAL